MIIAIRRTAWDQLPAARLELLRGDTVPTLGDPAIYADANGVEWCVFDDDRINENHTIKSNERVNRPNMVRALDSVPADWAPV